MIINIRQISENEGAAWDELIFSSRQKSLFLTHDFLKMWLDTDSSVDLLRLGCFDEKGNLVAGQSILHRKKLGIRLQYIVSIIYSSTPILREEIQDDIQARHEILSSLARVTRKKFPYLRVEFDPSLIDARPYLEQGWTARPLYTHIWDIADPEAILKNLHRKRSYVRKAQEFLVFGQESGNEILDAFLPLYRETMVKYNWKPTSNWCTNFRKRVAWLESRDLFRLYTCRTQKGELVGAVLYIINKPNQTAFFWMTGYDHSFNFKEFPPAIHWYAAKEMCPDVRYIDFMDGNEPSLYAFKDSLGSVSRPYWLVKMPHTEEWMSMYYRFKKIAQKTAGIFR